MSTIKLIAEIGINHNGNIEIAKDLIDVAKVARFDYVKFQKRNPDIAVPEEQKNKEKIVPWRNEPTTYLQYKKDIEFDKKQYAHLMVYAKQKGLGLFVSIWDIDSAKEMSSLFDMVKIPSAKLTDFELLEECKYLYKYRILSTGMSTEKEIDKAVEILNPQVIMHTNSNYPTSVQDLKLGYIRWLKDHYYPAHEIGYSSHYYGTKDIYFAIGIGATWIEKHITLDHTMWGSDQKASVEPNGVYEIGKAVRDIENSFDGNEPRKLYLGEEKKRESLRGMK